MTESLDNLWQKLAEFDIVSGRRPGILNESAPWYVKLISAASGWVAAVFFVTFVGAMLGQILDNSAVTLVCGAIVLITAHMTLRRNDEGFVTHLGLALSLTGQALIAWVIVRNFSENATLCCALIAAFEFALVALMPNYLHRIFSTVLALCFLYVTITFDRDLSAIRFDYYHSLLVALFMFVAASLWFNELQHRTASAAFEASAWGVTITLLIVESFAIFQPIVEASNALAANFFGLNPTTITELLLTAVFVWVTLKLIDGLSPVSSRVKNAAIAGALVIGLLAVKAPGIGVGMMLILIGHHHQNLVLKGFGAIALLVYISRYYYLMDKTLMYKAGVLMALGLGLLGARMLILNVARKAQ
ncbi:MAG: DUF4401 domain-containing protein [Pseudomonadota bacterium]